MPLFNFKNIYKQTSVITENNIFIIYYFLKHKKKNLKHRTKITWLSSSCHNMACGTFKHTTGFIQWENNDSDGPQPFFSISFRFNKEKNIIF